VFASAPTRNEVGVPLSSPVPFEASRASPNLLPPGTLVAPLGPLLAGPRPRPGPRVGQTVLHGWAFPAPGGFPVRAPGSAIGWELPGRPPADLSATVHPDLPGPLTVNLSSEPDEDGLSIDLLNDSFFLGGMSRIMAEARARGLAGPKAGCGGRHPHTHRAFRIAATTSANRFSQGQNCPAARPGRPVLFVQSVSQEQAHRALCGTVF
jgi:hypothetical protein